MKIKWFLRGLGVGILVTAILLCTSYRKEKDSGDLINQAKKIGMVFPKEETSPVDQVVMQNSTPEPAVSTESAVTVQEEETEQEKQAKQKIENSKDKIESASAYHNKKQSFVVREGLLSSSVAREMEEQGIIKDADEFDDYMEKNGYAKKVRSGKYDIPEDADYKTIAKIITREK
ncbi:MAG: hypothetical protein SO023_04100 [Eubacterium sp.]|nr:hypothetical protein [Eubacterium sp.]